DSLLIHGADASNTNSRISISENSFHLPKGVDFASHQRRRRIVVTPDSTTERDRFTFKRYLVSENLRSDDLLRRQCRTAPKSGRCPIYAIFRNSDALGA